MEELILELKEKIIKALNLEEMTPDEIETEAPLFGDGLGLDSIDALELIVMLEKDYGIKVVHWNTGDRCSAENAPAEFEAARKLLVNIPNGTAYIFDKGSHIEYKDVIEMITKGVY